jgi:hypothetical protein
MAVSWLVRSQDRSYGPFSLEQLQSLVASGRLVPASPVSLDGQVWTSAGKVKGLAFSNLAPVPGRPIPFSPAHAATPIPVAVQPMAVQPMAVQPVAVQPVAVQPVAMQPAGVSGPSEPGMEFLASAPSRPAKTPLPLAKKNSDSGLVAVVGAAAVFLVLATVGAYYAFISPSKEATLHVGDSGWDRLSREASGETSEKAAAEKPAGEIRQPAAAEKPAAAKQETTPASAAAASRSGTRVTYVDDSSEQPGKSREPGAAQPVGEMKPVVTDLASVDAALNAEQAAARQAAVAANAGPPVAKAANAWTSFGATNESEDAVDKALKWLAAHQLPNGSWSYDHTQGAACHGQCSDPGKMAEAVNGATGMALLCFISHGNTHAAGRYQGVVLNGLKFLIMTRMHPDGSMHEGGGRMYSHALATMALCEDLRIRKDKEFRNMTSEGLGVMAGPAAGQGEADEKPAPGFRPHTGVVSFRDKQTLKEQKREGQAMEGVIASAALRAAMFIIRAQDTSNGGWRYEPKKPDSDVSVTGWQVMALYSAGKVFPNAWHDGLNKFLDKLQANHYGSQYGYHLTDDKNPTPTRSAIGLLCRLYTTWNGGEQGFTQGTESLARTGISRQDMYQDYYVTLLLHHVGGKLWDGWNEQMRTYLISSQATAGHEAGSWSFRGGWSANGGRHYDTCLATLILEVYYRSKPILWTSDGTGAMKQQ